MKTPALLLSFPSLASQVHLLDSFLNNKGIEAIVCSDVGSHQCLLTQYLRLHHPRQWLMEGGLASMGCGLPAAIGAAMANPQATCLAVAGDGGFAMTSQELIMAKVYKLNVKVGCTGTASVLVGLWLWWGSCPMDIA